MTTEDFLIKAKEEIVKHFADPKNRLAALNFILKTFNDNYVSSFPKEEFICYSIICYLEQIDLVSSHALNNLSFTGFYNKLDSDAIEIKLHKIIPELKHPKDCGVYLGAWNHLLHEKFTQIKPDDRNIDNTNKLKIEYIQSCLNKLS